LKSRVKKIKIKEEYTVCSFIEPKVGHVYDIRNVPDLYTMLRVRRGRVVVFNYACSLEFNVLLKMKTFYVMDIVIDKNNK
jgi:hypothetical protein